MFCNNTPCVFLSVAPIKALCSQCFESWKKKFGPLGLNCKELTGDTEIDDFFEIQDSHIILTTPVCDTTLRPNLTNATIKCDKNLLLSISCSISLYFDRKSGTA